MNAYQRKRNCAAAALLAAALLAAPACAAALETTPLVPGAQNIQQEAERMPAFGRNRGYLGISASSKWLRQARLDGIMLNLRVHTLMGEEITFAENLGPASAGDKQIRLSLIANCDDEGLMLQLDQEAIDFLRRINVTEIAVANAGRSILGCYLVEDLAAVRQALGLKAGELLCVSGDADPVTVVSEDGVRRAVTR